MKLSNQVKITKRGKKRIGRGWSSGKGKTAGRGTKGQKARGTIARTFEGGSLPLIKRLPFVRGKLKNKSLRAKPVVIQVESLAVFKKGQTVDVKALVAKGLIDETSAKVYGIKVIGSGDVSLPSLKVNLPVSKGAAVAITKAKGTVQSD